MNSDLDLFRYKNNFQTYEHVPSISIMESLSNSVPITTIAIPTYKRPKLLIEALNSAINQENFQDYEILVVDNDPERNCTTEKLMRGIDNPKIRYYKNKDNIEMFGNWNRCIELAKGEYITILNDDDILDKYFLFYSMKTAFKTNKLVFTSANKIYTYPFKFNRKHGLLKKLLKQNIEPKDYIIGNQSYGTLGMIYRTHNMKSLGGFNKAYFPSADYVFNAQYVLKHRGIKLLRKLSYYRILENESIKESNLQKWPKIDSKIKKSIHDYLYPSTDRSSLLLYALIHQKKYLKKQWGAKIHFDEKELNFINKKYFLFDLRIKTNLVLQIIKGSLNGTS